MQEKQGETFYNKLREIYEKESKGDHYETEQPIIENILGKIEAVLKDIYELVEPIGLGGSGVVFCIRDLRLDAYRALKIPRPIHEKLIDSVKNEIEYLTKLRHENIISIHTLGEVSVDGSNYPYFVMSYIEDASDLKSTISHLLDNTKHSGELENITYWVLDKFCQIANALKFLHKNEVIHFDIKPSNILVDKNHKPILTDLGFAKRKSDSDSEIVVGFTKPYAHPDLREDYSDQSSKNRVRKKLRPRDFKYSFDIYAFGKSLLEILYLIDQKFNDVVPYDYTFGYLHLAACRMLDGKNLSIDETKRIAANQIHAGIESTVFKEIWQELNDIQDYNQIKYACFDDIIKDFSKLITREHFNKLVPELNMFYPKVVKSSQGICAPFSERVRAIIEHPVFERLNDARQLAFINTIYPTATHTRLEHSIGTFRNAVLYVQALYNDTYNPLFRQLMDEKDIKCILLASLLHDIGHYPLAHDLGEFNPDLAHEKYNSNFLESPAKDKAGRTLKETIEDENYGWGVKINDIVKLLKIEIDQSDFFDKEDLKYKIISSIIDGPIDVDKLDYLLRDSQNCYLRYGEFVDFDRLISNLTVIIFSTGYRGRSLSLGIYEKGQSAAESLTFARYLLYQSLYWHHTSRSIKVMLRETMETIDRNKFKNKNFNTEFDKFIGAKGELKNKINEYSVLEFLRKWTKEEGNRLIDMIVNRKYYKRILTIHADYKKGEVGKVTFLEKFRRHYKDHNFQELLQGRILLNYNNFINNTGYSRETYILSKDHTNRVAEMLKEPNMILCDCPDPRYGTEKKLRVISEPQRLRKNYSERFNNVERISEVWNEIHFNLMNIAAKGRIFCHPDIREDIMVAIGPDGIQECMEQTMNIFLSKKK